MESALGMLAEDARLADGLMTYGLNYDQSSSK